MLTGGGGSNNEDHKAMSVCTTGSKYVSALVVLGRGQVTNSNCLEIRPCIFEICSIAEIEICSNPEKCFLTLK